MPAKNPYEPPLSESPAKAILRRRRAFRVADVVAIGLPLLLYATILFPRSMRIDWHWGAMPLYNPLPIVGALVVIMWALLNLFRCRWRVVIAGFLIYVAGCILLINTGTRLGPNW